MNELLNNNYKANFLDTFIIGDKTVSNEQDLVKSFNGYFVNLRHSLAAKIHSATLPNNYLGDPNPSSLFFSNNRG